MFSMGSYEHLCELQLAKRDTNAGALLSSPSSADGPPQCAVSESRFQKGHGSWRRVATVKTILGAPARKLVPLLLRSPSVADVSA